jgi:hypothetical protein
MVVAEGFALEGGGGASVASFEDVGAEGADVLDDFDGLVHEHPSLGYFLAQSLVMKRLRSGLRYVLGHTWSGPKPFCGLNAKARRLAGLTSLLYRLIITWRVKLLPVENVVGYWWERSNSSEMKMLLARVVGSSHVSGGWKAIQSFRLRLHSGLLIEWVSGTPHLRTEVWGT